jgi:hypothetical protein
MIALLAYILLLNITLMFLSNLRTKRRNSLLKAYLARHPSNVDFNEHAYIKNIFIFRSIKAIIRSHSENEENQVERIERMWRFELFLIVLLFTLPIYAKKLFII